MAHQQASSEVPSTTAEAAITFTGLSKTFAGQRALNDVSVSFQRGKITALLGMNGSGKSTLIKILAGVYQPDPESQLALGGQPVSLPMTPASAHEHGLRFLHQDVGLVDALTIADNFAFVDRFRTKGPFKAIDRKAQFDHVAATLAYFKLPLSPNQTVSELTPSQRTMVGVARAFQDAEADGTKAFARNVLVLDEPTASLPAEEVDAILSTVEDLRDNGGTVIYVSHRTDEVKRIADQLVILRDGKLIADEPVLDMTVDDIVTRVVGRRLEKQKISAPADREGSVALAATGLTGNRLRDIDLSVRSGEILGIAGLVGCGRSELMRILGGIQAPRSGSMQLNGRSYTPATPSAAIKAGVASVPQDRRAEGCVLPMSVKENLTMGRLGAVSRNGVLSARSERKTAQQMVTDYKVKTAALTQAINLLSGGNQQKVVVARAASHRGAVLLLDEPTQGVDALAKQEIWNIARRLADDGMSVVLASTDFEEFVGLCDRVMVLDRGRHLATAVGDDITEEHLSLLCAGTASR